MDQEERWLPVAGYESHYEVSDRGRVRSLDRKVLGRWGCQQTKTGRVCKPRRGTNGYLTVSLHRDGVRRLVGVHRLVAQAFVPGEATGLEVCHNDGDRDNNSPSNLRWDTHAGNMRDRRAHGTSPNAAKTHCAQGHPYSGENTSVAPNGDRRCRACWRANSARYKARKAVAA